MFCITQFISKLKRNFKKNIPSCKKIESTGHSIKYKFIVAGNKDGKEHQIIYCFQEGSGFISIAVLLYWNNKSIVILALDTHYNTPASCRNTQYEFKSPQHGTEGGHMDLANQ